MIYCNIKGIKMNKTYSIRLDLDNPEALAGLSIPWVKGMGLFIPSSYLTKAITNPNMGDLMNVAIFFQKEKHPFIIQGKVILKQPPKKRGQEHGVGLQITFDDGEKFTNFYLSKISMVDRNKIDTMAF